MIITHRIKCFAEYISVLVESETLKQKADCQPTHELSISLEKLRDLDLPKRQDMNLSDQNNLLADSSNHPPIKNEYGLPEDFQNVNFLSDNSLKKAVISKPEKTNLINQLSASKLMKHSLLCKLKGKRRVNNSPEKQTLEMLSQTSSSNVLNLQNPEAMKVQKSSFESPPEIPCVPLPGSVNESSRTTLVENVEISKETSVIHDAMESSGEVSSSSHLNKTQVETQRVTYSTCTDNDISDTDFAGVIVPPPYEFAGGNAEVSDRFIRWDSVLESFDKILNSSFSDEIDINPNAAIVNTAVMTMASDFHDETQGESDVDIFDNDKHRSDKTGLSENEKIEQFSEEDISLLPFAPLGFNDYDNGEDLSAKFLDYFSRDVGDLDTSRFTETESLPSYNQPAFSQTAVKRTYPVGVKTLAPKPQFPKRLENFKSTNNINLRKTNVINGINSVKSFMPEDNVNKQDDCIDAIGTRPVDTPKKVSSASLLSTVPLPDVVHDLVSLDDCERFLIPPPAHFSNIVVKLQDEDTTTD